MNMILYRSYFNINYSNMFKRGVLNIMRKYSNFKITIYNIF